MDEYGGCTLSKCVYEGNEISCSQCSFYNKYFFKEKEQELEEDLRMEMDERQVRL